VVRKHKRTLLFLLVVTTVVVLGWWWRPTPEKRVRKKCNALAARFSKTAGESSAVMAAKMHTFGDLLGDNVVLDLDGFSQNGLYGNSELSSIAARARTQFQAVQLTFTDLSVVVIAPDDATATFTARLVAETKEGQRDSDTREIRCMLRKVDDKWVFTEFHEVRVMVR